jgi:glycosyltransferase involved in cell wall biosynthesis
MSITCPNFEPTALENGMRILVVSSLPPYPGGAEISLGHFVEKFSKKGHSISCISPASHSLINECAEFDSRHPEFRIHRYTMPDLDFLPYIPNPDFFACEKKKIETCFTAIVEQFPPDLIISGRDSFAPIVIPLAIKAGLPCVQLLRGSPSSQIIDGNYPSELALAFLQHLQDADQVIAVSEHMARGMRELGISQAFCIPNAVNTTLFKPLQTDKTKKQELNIPDSGPVILSPSNIIPRKRPFDLLCAAEIALSENPDLQFVVLGQGTELERFTYAVTQSPARENIHLLGWKSYESMPALLNSADIVVMTSESEGMSRACIEAMACGKLLIASDIAPSKELINDGISGLLFPLGDCRALAKQILWAIDHPSEIKRIGQRARTEVLNRNYTPIINRYLVAFQKVVEE